jgi:hypothetical protein
MDTKKRDNRGQVIDGEYKADVSLWIWSLDNKFRQWCREIIIPRGKDIEVETNNLIKQKTKMMKEGEDEQTIERVQTDIFELNRLANSMPDQDEIDEEDLLKESTSRFEYLILFFILVSCVHLTLDNPLNNPHGKLQHGL